jgi:DNA-binding transcriptional LysR family regulator
MLLFERSTRRVTPTLAARKFEPLARRMVEDFDAGLATMTGVANSSNDQVVIASIPAAATHFLPQAIRRLRLKLPDVKVRILECRPEQGLDWVRSGEAELCINLIGATEADLTYTHLVHDPYVFVCHRSHGLANRRSISWPDLRTHPLVRMGYSPESGRAVESRVLLDNAVSKMNVQLDWRYEAHSLSTVMGLIEAGICASILPRLAAPRTSKSHILIKSIHPPVVTRAIGVVERRRGVLSPAAKFLRDILLFGRTKSKPA